MDSPFDNIDIIKIILGIFKDEPHYLLKLAHTSSFLRKEIIENDLFPHIINIIKNNNIYQVKQIEKDIINIKRNKDSLITLLKNNKSNLREMEKANIEDTDAKEFIKKQILNYKNIVNKNNDKINNLNLRLESLRKKNLFFNQEFVELMFIPQPIQRLRGYNYYYLSNYRTTIYVDNIKLKYIVKDDNGEYKYIENLYYHKKSKLLHLTNCGSLLNSELNNCVFIKKDDLIDHDDIEFTHCKKCTRDIRNFLI